MAEIEYHALLGQSYTNASKGNPALTTTAPYPGELQEVRSAIDAPAPGEPVDLHENHEYDKSTLGERPSSALGVGIYGGGAARPVTLTTYGIGGRTLSQLTGSASDEHLQRLTDFVAWAAGGSDTVRFWALHYMQGERDQRAGTTPATYVTNMGSLYSKWNAGVKTATGQTEDLLAIIQDQMDGWTEYDNPWPRIGLAQLECHRTLAYHTLVGPRYHLNRSSDGLHLQNDSYRHLGEMHHRVHDVLRAAGTWHPVSPWSITRDGRFVTIQFYVPVAPLVFDDTQVPPVANRGFSWHDTDDPSDSSTQSAHVISVSLAGPTTVVLELNTAPTGSTGHVAAGWLDRHINLRDSDTFVSEYDSTPLQNWCCHFYDPVGLSLTPPGDLPEGPPQPTGLVAQSFDGAVGLGWNGASFAQPGPPQPTGLTATGGDGEVLLEWHELPSTGDDHELVTADLSHTSSLDAATVAQTHALTPADIGHAHSVEASGISQVHALSPADLEHGQTIDATTLAQAHVLVPAELSQGQSLDATTVAQGHILAPADISNAADLDATTVSQGHILVTADLEHSQAVDATTVALAALTPPTDLTATGINATRIDLAWVLTRPDLPHRIYARRVA